MSVLSSLFILNKASCHLHLCCLFSLHYKCWARLCNLTLYKGYSAFWPLTSAHYFQYQLKYSYSIIVLKLLLQLSVMPCWLGTKWHMSALLSRPVFWGWDWQVQRLLQGLLVMFWTSQHTVCQLQKSISGNFFSICVKLIFVAIRHDVLNK